MWWPIVETAGAAVLAWYLAKLLFGSRETGFAPIATLICLGTALGQQRRQALELIAGVILGVIIADALVRVLGTGPPQVGLMVIIAMSVAAFAGGGTMVTTEAGVSAIIIGSSTPATIGVVPVRPLEALLGGAVALAVHALVFPPDPLLYVSRAAHRVFPGLARSLNGVARALRDGTADDATRALEAARAMDDDVRAYAEALDAGRETARSSPVRRPARDPLGRQQRLQQHLDLAVRNVRVLARDTVRHVRGGGAPLPELADAADDLAQAVWAIARGLDDTRGAEDARALTLRAAGRATQARDRPNDPTVVEIAGRLRSTAADLLRAAQAVAADPQAGSGVPTEELLAHDGEP